MSNTPVRKKIPRPILWGINKEKIRGKKYLQDLDYIKAHTLSDTIYLSIGDGVQLENLQQSHKVMKEYVDYAHKLGLRVVFRQTHVAGFFNAGINSNENTPKEIDQASLFTISDPAKAEGIVNDYELTADENGYAFFEHTAKWGRDKIRPLYNQVLKVYAFRKKGEGFYEPGTLLDVTDKMQIVNSRPNYCEVEFDGGKELAGYTIFCMIVQYFNKEEFFGLSNWEAEKKLMDSYKDVPFDGVCMDEAGYLLLNTTPVYAGKEPPFRGRFYSRGQEKYYAEKLGLDLSRLLLDMRYAPTDDEKIKIKAINIYFDELRKPIIQDENLVAAHAKKLWGEDVYLSAHNTFHNNLDCDEIWHTACAWWDLPRDFGHTDENITFPVRMGVMLAAKEPLMLDMYYSPIDENYYHHIVEGLPFNCREFHHPWNDKTGTRNFLRKDFREMIRKLDVEAEKLDAFQTFYPKLDLLVIYGNAAQNNWYPDYEARNLWDIDGSLHIQGKVHEMWEKGYRCALVPDYAITDGRIRCENGKISFNGHFFSHALFLYPKYARKEVYEFLNKAGEAGVPIAAVGKRADIDFDGNKAKLTIPHFEEYDLSILEKIACPKSGIPNGGIYTDGSFVLVSYSGLVENTPEEVDIQMEGVHYKGLNTGILAWRNGLQYATKGGSLEVVTP